MSDQPMHDEQDPVLARLFAAQDNSLPGENFIAQLVTRLEREQRKQRLYAVIAVVAILVLGASVAPWVAQTLPVLVDLTSAVVETFGSLLLSPLVWLVVGALVFAFLPVVYVWRIWRN